MHAERVVATVDAHRGEVAVRVVGTGDRVGHRAPVQDRRVVSLLQGIGNQLPVGLDLGMLEGRQAHIGKRKAVERAVEFTQILGQ